MAMAADSWRRNLRPLPSAALGLPRVAPGGCAVRILIVASSLVLGVMLFGCEPTDPCPGKDVCGQGCMDAGGSCCPDGLHHCNPGYYCSSDSAHCYATGGGGGGGNTCPVNTCINNLCSPGLWCCTTGCQGCGCR
jgi:hypothetical protein